MILDAILLVFQGVITVLLAPFGFISVGVDFISKILLFTPFLQVIAYIIPFKNILPLIIITFSLVGIRITISIIKFILKFIPGLG